MLVYCIFGCPAVCSSIHCCPPPSALSLSLYLRIHLLAEPSQQKGMGDKVSSLLPALGEVAHHHGYRQHLFLLETLRCTGKGSCCRLSHYAE